jgi:hypothetical protein
MGQDSESNFNWERYVRGFRKEHQFVLTTGTTRGRWSIDHFGTIEDKSIPVTGFFTRFQYSYHLPLRYGLGYLVGSSAGYQFEAADRKKEFGTTPGIIFPGLVAGLVFDASPEMRFGAAIELYLQRYDGLKDRDGVEPNPKIHLTTEVVDLQAFFDLFYDLEWAIRAEFHARTGYFVRPRDHENKAVDAEFTKTDQWLGIGLVYHLL